MTGIRDVPDALFMEQISNLSRKFLRSCVNAVIIQRWGIQTNIGVTFARMCFLKILVSGLVPVWPWSLCLLPMWPEVLTGHPTWDYPSVYPQGCCVTRDQPQLVISVYHVFHWQFLVCFLPVRSVFLIVVSIDVSVSVDCPACSLLPWVLSN